MTANKAHNGVIGFTGRSPCAGLLCILSCLLLFSTFGLYAAAAEYAWPRAGGALSQAAFSAQPLTSGSAVGVLMIISAEGSGADARELILDNEYKQMAASHSLVLVGAHFAGNLQLAQAGRLVAPAVDDALRHYARQPGFTDVDLLGKIYFGLHGAGATAWALANERSRQSLGFFAISSEALPARAGNSRRVPGMFVLGKDSPLLQDQLSQFAAQRNIGALWAAAVVSDPVQDKGVRSFFDAWLRGVLAGRLPLGSPTAAPRNVIEMDGWAGSLKDASIIPARDVRRREEGKFAWLVDEAVAQAWAGLHQP